MIVHRISSAEIREIFPPRSRISNKGSYGKALLISGSYTMPGACVIASTGAVNTGVGLLTVAFPDVIYPSVTAKLTEPVLFPCKTAEDGTFSDEEISRIIAKAKTMNAVAIGPGLGISNSTRKLVTTLLTSYTGKLILDADALNIVSENPDILWQSRADIGITPHPGEMSRLTGKTIDEILDSREETALEFAEKYSICVLLKGHNTVIAAPSYEDGKRRVFLNPTGTPAMARGGCGDLLTGMVLSFCAQGKTVMQSLVAGAYIHGKAGERADDRYGEYCCTVMRIAGEINRACFDGKR